nr:hypothetical protein Cry52Nrm2_p148 [Cryptomonas curvata]
MYYSSFKISKKKIFEVRLKFFIKENMMNFAFWNKNKEKSKECKNKFTIIKILKKKQKKNPIFNPINSYKYAIYQIYTVGLYIF